MNNIDLDRIADYKAEYLAAIEKAKITGTRLTGLCPFHRDRNASFSADLETGMFNCFACGAKGNFITFWADTHGTDTKDAYRAILEKYHVEPEKRTYTVEEYAAKKHLPADWLVENFQLASETDQKTGEPWIRIPYFDEAGRKVLFRKRFKEGSANRFKWSYGSAGKLRMYGEWRLKFFREVEKRVIMVEGESDTQTLWFLGLPGLGVPGASTFKPEWCERLKAIDALYLHIEPDQGGETFLQQMAQKLHDGGYTGKVYRWSCGEYGEKDPSALFIKYGKEEAAAKIRASLDNAAPLDLARLTEPIPTAVEGAPIRLRQPEGWIFSEKGISAIDEKTATPHVICRTPILITRRLRSLETGDEKIEVAFKRDGEWHSIIQPRSVIFQSRSITTLADQGMTITSENSRLVVRFLEKLEAENIDIIERADSASTFGWQGAKTFLPGLAPNIVLDIEPSLRGWAAAYCQSGTLDAWKAMVAPHRSRNRFRFILAASFTAPLLRIVRQRIFFVYNWGGSKGGKTAALKAALSAWGDPERLTVNFNATQVALERMAGFYCDLPLGIDERQLAGNNQGAIEKIVYMLTSGTGKIRGSKTGGLQALQTWRTVILATGEEPITTETSQTGVSTRVLEIYGPPFDDERSAGLMHQSTAENYGWAGIEFVRRIIATGEDAIKERFAAMLEFVYTCTDGRNGSHAAGIAAVATADALLSEWLFAAPREEAEARARQMAEDIVRENAENSVRDVNETATQYVADWIASNDKGFHGDGYGPRLGEIDGNFAYIFPSILNKAIADGGFSTRKTLKYFAEQEIIETYIEGGAVRYSQQRRFNGSKQRMVKVDLTLITADKWERAERLERTHKEEDVPTQTGFDGFTEVDDDEPLPF